MNKYLSYEKSKRLAELGYAIENPSQYWRTIEQHRAGAAITHPLVRELVPRLTGVYYDSYTAPDCHDLLLAMQEFKFRLTGLGDEFHIVTRPNGVDPGYLLSVDSNPVEALGAALIALLESNVEEKQ